MVLDGFWGIKTRYGKYYGLVHLNYKPYDTPTFATREKAIQALDQYVAPIPLARGSPSAWVAGRFSPHERS